MKQVGQDLRQKADSAVSNYVQLHVSLSGNFGGENVGTPMSSTFAIASTFHSL
jgi:hypothetical protein